MAGTAVRMKISEDAHEFVMDILTDMYGDPELAVIREYSTNALDSHVEAGQTRPIEVRIPTPYVPTFTVRDYGVGLDYEGIVRLYSQYGASSKRETNTAQGMLGIGCKSALAYTDQFTVVGFKDGKRTQVVISRDQDGAATQTIVSEDEGDYENGVEVTIPAKSDNSMAEKAQSFYRFWPPGSVVITDGKTKTEPTKIAAGGTDEHGDDLRNIWLDDRTLLTNEVDQDLVVMGYVAYPLVEGEDDLFKSPGGGRQYTPGRGYHYGKTYSAVCFVDIGEVNFSPSRESLRMTRRTKDKLAELRQHIRDTLDSSIRDQIANASTAKEAQDLVLSGVGLGWDNGGNPAQWQGRDVLLSLTRTHPATAAGTVRHLDPDAWDVELCLKYSYLFANQNSYSRKQGERSSTLDLRKSDLSVFVGFDGKWLTNVKRAKMELWASTKGHTIGKSVFIDKLNADEKFWLSGWPVYDWAEVDATELPKSVSTDGGVKRLSGSYDIIKNGVTEPGVPAHKIDTTQPLYYVHGNQWTASSHRALRSGALDKTTCTIVALSQNRIEKFKRDFPMALELTDAARRAAEAWLAKIDADQVKAHAVKEHRGHYVLAALKGQDFDDPTLNTLVRLAHTDSTAYESGLEKFGLYVETPDASAVRKLIDSTTKKYPLAPWTDHWQRISGIVKEHTVLYLNAAIAATKGA